MQIIVQNTGSMCIACCATHNTQDTTHNTHITTLHKTHTTLHKTHTTLHNTTQYNNIIINTIHLIASIESIQPIQSHSISAASTSPSTSSSTTSIIASIHSNEPIQSQTSWILHRNILSNQSHTNYLDSLLLVCTVLNARLLSVQPLRQ